VSAPGAKTSAEGVNGHVDVHDTFNTTLVKGTTTANSSLLDNEKPSTASEREDTEDIKDEDLQSDLTRTNLILTRLAAFCVTDAARASLEIWRTTFISPPAAADKKGIRKWTGMAKEKYDRYRELWGLYRPLPYSSGFGAAAGTGRGARMDSWPAAAHSGASWGGFPPAQDSFGDGGNARLSGSWARKPISYHKGRYLSNSYSGGSLGGGTSGDCFGFRGGYKPNTGYDGVSSGARAGLVGGGNSTRRPSSFHLRMSMSTGSTPGSGTANIGGLGMGLRPRGDGRIGTRIPTWTGTPKSTATPVGTGVPKSISAGAGIGSVSGSGSSMVPGMRRSNGTFVGPAVTPPRKAFVGNALTSRFGFEEHRRCVSNGTIPGARTRSDVSNRSKVGMSRSASYGGGTRSSWNGSAIRNGSGIPKSNSAGDDVGGGTGYQDLAQHRVHVRDYATGFAVTPPRSTPRGGATAVLQGSEGRQQPNPRSYITHAGLGGYDTTGSPSSSVRHRFGPEETTATSRPAAQIRPPSLSLSGVHQPSPLRVQYQTQQHQQPEPTTPARREDTIVKTATTITPVAYSTVSSNLPASANPHLPPGSPSPIPARTATIFSPGGGRRRG
jgi:hypothetical protein